MFSTSLERLHRFQLHKMLDNLRGDTGRQQIILVTASSSPSAVLLKFSNLATEHGAQRDRAAAARRAQLALARA